MISWLHTFHPQPILATLGPIHIYWYGLLVILGISAGLLVTRRLAKLYNLDYETVFDLAFWLIIFGLLGARLYDVGLNLSYYGATPSKFWKSGRAVWRSTAPSSPD